MFDLLDINMGFHPIPGFFFCVPKRITKKRAPQIVSYPGYFSPACLPVGRLGKFKKLLPTKSVLKQS
jgi:hypothetical protein